MATLQDVLFDEFKRQLAITFRRQAKRDKRLGRLTPNTDDIELDWVPAQLARLVKDLEKYGQVDKVRKGEYTMSAIVGKRGEETTIRGEVIVDGWKFNIGLKKGKGKGHISEEQLVQDVRAKIYNNIVKLVDPVTLSEFFRRALDRQAQSLGLDRSIKDQQLNSAVSKLSAKVANDEKLMEGLDKLVGSLVDRGQLENVSKGRYGLQDFPTTRWNERDGEGSFLGIHFSVEVDDWVFELNGFESNRCEVRVD